MAGFEMTSPVRQQLRRLQEAWQRWTGAWYQGDQQTAATVLEEILGVTEYLGMEHLPDLGLAAGAYAVQAARAGDAEKAAWALEAARALDPGVPDLALAEAEVARLQGNWGGWVSHRVRAVGMLAGSRLHEPVLRANLVEWVIYLLLLAGGLFVILQLAVKGRQVQEMLRQVLGDVRGMPGVLVGVLALLWPLLLPNGLTWLILYWSVLLWTWCATSERVALILFWMVLGVAPVISNFQEKQVQLATSPPVRAVENLRADRLYGAIFSDLAVLRTLLPESAAGRELVADLHRAFGQWEHARSEYQNLLEERGVDDASSAAVLNNLGIYHYEKGDYGTAIQLLRDSSELRGTAAVFYNLSQAYSKSYNFERAHEALAQAKAVEPDSVESWLGTGSTETEPVDVVGIDGGLEHSSQIYSDLRLVWTPESELPAVEFWRRHLALGAVVVALLLAVGIDFARRRWVGDVEAEDGSGAGWVDALVPGLASARAGHGIRALGALTIPIALVVAPMMRAFGYRLPLSIDPGFSPTLPIAVVGLVAYFGVRLLLQARES